MDNYRFSTLAYQRPDLEARRAQLAQWKDAVEHAESYDALRSLIFEIDRESCRLFTQYAIAHIRHTLDTRDEFYEAEIHYLQDTLPTLGAAEVALNETIAASPFRPDIEQEFGKQYFVSIDLQKKQFCDANIPLRQQESRLTNEYQKIMATAEIPFDGKTLNLYGVQKYFEHPDRAVRAAAVKAYAGFYEKNEPRLEEIWDELIRIRNQMGKNLGYENYIPLGYLEQGRTDVARREDGVPGRQRRACGRRRVHGQDRAEDVSRDQPGDRRIHRLHDRPRADGSAEQAGQGIHGLHDLHAQPEGALCVLLLQPHHL